MIGGEVREGGVCGNDGREVGKVTKGDVRENEMGK